MNHLEKFLNFIIWCIHDIGRSIKDNPFTRAWRDLEKPKIEWPGFGIGEALENARRLICEADEKSRTLSLGELAYQSSKQMAQMKSAIKPKELTGFKKHVNREKRLLELIKPIQIWHTPYSAFNLPRREMMGVIVASEPEKKANWFHMVGGGASAFYSARAAARSAEQARFL